MSDMTLAVGDADAGLRDQLDQEINACNAAATGHHDGRALSVAVRGDGGDLRAGLYGWTWGGCGYIVLRRGCDRVALSTHSFQAPGFYARLGYTECGRTPGYPHGHDDIHLVKNLS
jgi:hypothetical protein